MAKNLHMALRNSRSAAGRNTLNASNVDDCGRI